MPGRREWGSGNAPREGDIVVFTDGSKTEEGTGAGIYCEEQKMEISILLGISAAVFQSETMAVGKACRKLDEQQVAEKRIVICSDIESAIKAISSCKISAKSVLRARESLETLSEKNTVSLVRVPGHSGVPGNEKADELARKGSGTPFIGPEPVIGVNSSTMVKLLKHEVEKEHQKFENGPTSCRQAKEFLEGCNLWIRFKLQIVKCLFLLL